MYTYMYTIVFERNNSFNSSTLQRDVWLSSITLYINIESVEAAFAPNARLALLNVIQHDACTQQVVLNSCETKKNSLDLRLVDITK